MAVNGLLVSSLHTTAQVSSEVHRWNNGVSIKKNNILFPGLWASGSPRLKCSSMKNELVAEKERSARQSLKCSSMKNGLFAERETSARQSLKCLPRKNGLVAETERFVERERFAQQSLKCSSMKNGLVAETRRFARQSTSKNSRSLACLAVASPGSTDPSGDRKQFLDAAKEGNLVPLYKRVFSDQLTPVLAYRCLVEEDDRDSPSFLFESMEHGKSSNYEGRFSSLGTRPVMEIIAKEDSIVVLNKGEISRSEEKVADPMSEPEKISSKWKPVKVDGLPDTFCGGWVGYFSYDTLRYVERRKLSFETAPEDDRGLPDIHLGLYSNILVFDHVFKLVYAIHWVQLDEFENADQAYDDGKMHLDQLVAQIQAPRPRLPAGALDLKVGHYGEHSQVSNMSEEEYKARVVDAKEHILAGDIFQIVLSQRFERRTTADPFQVYRALRVVNPSPYMIYLQARGSILVGASPEILARIQKGKVTNRPLAGTRRRGKTSQDDQDLEEDLRRDEKEKAEHVMLVDLGRNDVGKVCKPGSVKVERLMDVERYSHVMHLSSTVTGELNEELTPWDALRAALPVGTVSGAPKVRAMQLIDEMEPNRRGPYSGGIGHVSFTGDMDIALALRTMVFPTSGHIDRSSSEWRVHLQAGAGVVADSNPASEHQECINKAAGMSRAIDLAEANFVE